MSYILLPHFRYTTPFSWSRFAFVQQLSQLKLYFAACMILFSTKECAIWSDNPWTGVVHHVDTFVLVAWLLLSPCSLSSLSFPANHPLVFIIVSCMTKNTMCTCTSGRDAEKRSVNARYITHRRGVNYRLMARKETISHN